MSDSVKKWLPVGLLVFFAVSRWPGLMPLNFSLAYGLVFCAGAFPRLLPGWTLVVVFLLTDVILNLFYYDCALFTDYQFVNYLGFGLIFLLGRQFGSRGSLGRLVGGGLLGAVIFYLVTNTAAWLQNPFYAKTIAGWFQALTTGETGWPQTWTFFRNTLLSGGLFAGLIGAGLKAIEPAEPEAREQEETEESGETKPEEKPVKA